MTDRTHGPILPDAFAQLGLRDSLLKALAKLQFTVPSDIQKLLIPKALEGFDLLGQARTGTGKTAAFSLPMLHQAERGKEFQAIILVPTRELCVQVDAEIQRLGQFTGLRSLPIYGGQRISAQMHFLKHGPEILVGTPGRVMDLLERRLIHFRNIRFVTLDEVDRMLDIGFRDDIRRILRRVSEYHSDQGWQPGAGAGAGGEDDNAIRKVGKGVQTIFVSATISPEIEGLARQYMREPVEKLVAPGADEKPTVANVEQYYFPVSGYDKYMLLRRLLDEERPELAIVFCRTKHGAERVAKRLHADGIECREIHGNLRQSKRESVMKSFRTGKFTVLVATDLASRGIDVQDITHIINYDVPEDPEAYVHRVGRTARMGAAGKAFTFIEPQQGEELTRIEMLINMIIPVRKMEGFQPSREPTRGLSETPAQAPAAPATPATPPAPPAPPRGLGAKMPVRRRRR